mgnify:CR=1 FL=1
MFGSLYPSWRRLPVTIVNYANTTYENTINCAGYSKITIQFHNCGQHTSSGQFYGNRYFHSITVTPSASNSNTLAYEYSWDNNWSGSAVANISGYSSVWVKACVDGSNDNGARWTCSNCAITITLE